MAQTQPLQITLSEESSEFIRRKVASGEYASEDEAVSNLIDYVRLDTEEEARLEREEVLAAYEEFIADPSSAIPLEQVRRELEADMLQRLKAS